MLAERSDVDRATIGRLESGALARMDTIHKLATALQVSAAELQAQPPEAS
jgi:transcriptional regulator with XRE-family HTH domain